MSQCSDLNQQKIIYSLFADCSTAEAKYQKIIEIGRQALPLNPLYKNPENIVRGCQSTLYLHSFVQNEKIIFETESDALISSGLAQLLVLVYSQQSAEFILKTPPDYLEELGITSSLTPNRANGLYSLHLRMKQEALKFLMQQQNSV